MLVFYGTWGLNICIASAKTLRVYKARSDTIFSRFSNGSESGNGELAKPLPGSSGMAIMKQVDNKDEEFKLDDHRSHKMYSSEESRKVDVNSWKLLENVQKSPRSSKLLAANSRLFSQKSSLANGNIGGLGSSSGNLARSTGNIKAGGKSALTDTSKNGGEIDTDADVFDPGFL